MSMFLLGIFDTSEFGNICHMFSNKEHAIFQFPILQHIQKSYVFKYEHVGVPIFDLSESRNICPMFSNNEHHMF